MEVISSLNFQRSEWEQTKAIRVEVPKTVYLQVNFFQHFTLLKCLGVEIASTDNSYPY